MTLDFTTGINSRSATSVVKILILATLRISPYLQERFALAMDAPSVQMVSIRGVHFVLVNSMAMEGDGCFLCRPAQIHLQQISSISQPKYLIFMSVTEIFLTDRLKCSKGAVKCKNSQRMNQYSRPILLQVKLLSIFYTLISKRAKMFQHFPMYRESDINCSGPDQAPEDEKKQKFRERWECLSRESSEMVVIFSCLWCNQFQFFPQLMEMIQPRVITTGHTHHGCHRIYSDGTHEWTVPSFSWRNKNNPSFILVR
jgi:ethanolamine phosphate phosphodiesterase